MPIALDRNETAEVCLRSDADKPEDARPVFLFYHLTRREARKVDELMERARAAASDAECEPLVRQVLLVGLAGWRNIRGRDGAEIPYSPDAIDDVLTAGEEIELAVRYPDEVAALGAKKKPPSTSPSASTTAASAPAAAPDAATPPPSGIPSCSTASPAPLAAAPAA